MSDVPLTNEQLAALQIIPGGATFGQAAETMGLSREEIGLPTVRDTPMPVNPNFISSRYVGTGKNRVRYDLYSNGERGPFADPEDEDDDGGDGGSSANTFTPRSDARNTIAAVLNRFGLGSLSGFLYDVYAKQEVDLNNPDALIFALRDRPEFQARFSANARRATKNLPELDPGSYLELENTYRSLLRANGLPAQFYDSNEDFADLIAGDVSPAELQARIQNGYRKVAEADPEVKRQMRQLYNVDDAGLAAYFLDPERAAPILEAQARSAQIAARAREQGGIQIGRMTAEELVSRGYTEQEAQQAFQRLNLLSGLYTEMAGEEQLTEAQKVGAAFGYDVEAAEELALRQRRRLAEFQTGGGFARTTGATSGTVETGLGGPQ